MDSRIPIMRVVKAWAFGALVCSFAAAPAVFAQEEPAEDPLLTVPLAQWIAAGPVAQIPWKVKIVAGGLSYHQRLVGNVDIQVDGKDMVGRPHEGSLVCLVRLTDEQGNAYQQHLEWGLDNVKAATTGSIMDFNFDPYVLPGVYRVLVVLWHTKNGEHSLMEKSLQIEPLKKDPLAEASSDLPRVEFSKENQSLDDLYQPDIQGKLHLPLATQRPLRVELLADVTPLGVRASAYRKTLGLLLPLLKTFSQIEVRNGTLGVEAFDLSHQRVSFEQEDLGTLDWEKLREVLPTSDPGVVGVRELQNRTQQAAFFRNEIARRLAAKPRETKERGGIDRGDSGRSGEGDPLRVIILISTWYEFESGNDLTPVVPPADCKCLVFYLRFVAATDREGHVVSTKAWKDDIEKLLGPLKPRVYEIDTPSSERQALADILNRVSQAGGVAAGRP
jgi:hypothetical protein